MSGYRISTKVMGLQLLLATLLLGYASCSSCPSELPFTGEMIKHNNKCYQFVHVERYWDEARDYCRQHGGSLVKIDSEEINDFIVRTLNGLSWYNNGVWIGLHDRIQELRWWWDGGMQPDEPLGWTNWGRGHPAATFHRWRDCVRMVRGSGDWLWHETPCHVLKWYYRFICEYPVKNPEVFATPASNYRIRGYDMKSKRTEVKSTEGEIKPTSSHMSSTSRQHHSEHLLTDGDKVFSVGEGNSALLQAASKEKEKSSATGTAAVISMSIFAVAILLLILFLLRRRRSKQLEIEEEDLYSHIAGDRPDKEKDFDKDERKQEGDKKLGDYLKREKEIWATMFNVAGVRSVLKPAAVRQNTYVDAPRRIKQSSTKTVPTDAYMPMNGSPPDKKEKKSGSEDSSVYTDMEEVSNNSYECEKYVKKSPEYDTPRLPNVYSEIDEKFDDEDERCEDAYECLEDVKQKVQLMNNDNHPEQKV